MSHIQVAAEDNRLFLFQGFEISKKSVFPFHAVGKPFQLILGVGRVYGYHIIMIKFKSDHTALPVMLLDSDSIGNAERLFLCKNGRSGISLFLRIIPVLMIAGKLQTDLAFLQLGFLNTEDIGIRFPEKIQKSFIETGPQTVDIP